MAADTDRPTMPIGGAAAQIVSLNLRKRLRHAKTHTALARWLAAQAPGVVLMQEAVPPEAALPPALGGLPLVGGNHLVACWAKPGTAVAATISPIPALLIETDTILICTTYLSAYSSKTRIGQLESLRGFLSGHAKPIVLAGDFNTAPMPADGLYGDNLSDWTSARERTALSHLTNELGLVDLTSPFRLGRQHFTFERINKGKWTRFRCDLAFGPDRAGVIARYDHEVRTGSFAFTDHSACIIGVQSGDPNEVGRA